MAKRPPSSCTIGRRSGGSTGSSTTTIHSGRLPDFRMASTMRSRFVAFFWRWPLVVSISSCSFARSAGRSIRSRMESTDSAPMPALKTRPKRSSTSRYSASESTVNESAATGSRSLSSHFTSGSYSLRTASRTSAI